MTSGFAKQSAFGRDRAVWLGLMALLLGLVLADRSFAFWRNDETNFVDINGNHREPNPERLRTWQDNHALQAAMASSGVTLLVISVVLLWRTGRDPAQLPE